MDWEAVASGFYSWFRSVPDVIWSGVIASLLTLGGVLLTNRGNSNRLIQQLSHDAAEKAKERIFQTRRDVYLKASHDLVNANSFLGSAPDFSDPQAKASQGLNELYASLSKVQLIGDSEASASATRLLTTYNSIYLSLMEYLVPISKAKSQIKLADRFYEDVHKKFDETLRQLDLQNQSSQPDQHVVKYLNNLLDFYNEQTHKYSSESQEAWKKHNDALEKYNLRLREKVTQQQPLMIKFMKETRRDLGLDMNIEQVEALLVEQIEVMSKQMDETLATIKKQFDEPKP